MLATKGRCETWAIDAVLVDMTNESNNNNDHLIPPQHRGLPSAVVEELWQPRTHVDPARTLEEKNRREQGSRRDQRAPVRRHDRGPHPRVEIGRQLDLGETFS